jgi:cation transport regulator
MPYRANKDLPLSVRLHLPGHAQAIYREAFNHAYAAHGGEAGRDERAHKIAWAAVKRGYIKHDDVWTPRQAAAS